MPSSTFAAGSAPDGRSDPSPAGQSRFAKRRQAACATSLSHMLAVEGFCRFRFSFGGLLRCAATKKGGVGARGGGAPRVTHDPLRTAGRRAEQAAEVGCQGRQPHHHGQGHGPADPGGGARRRRRRGGRRVGRAWTCCVDCDGHIAAGAVADRTDHCRGGPTGGMGARNRENRTMVNALNKQQNVARRRSHGQGSASPAPAGRAPLSPGTPPHPLRPPPTLKGTHWAGTSLTA